MVQIEAPSTPDCQEGVPSQGGQHREEHSVVQHVQVDHYQGQNHEQNHEQNQDSWTMSQTMNHKLGLDPIDHPV